MTACAVGLRDGYGGIEGTVIGWPAGPLGGDTTPAQNASVQLETDAGAVIAVATTNTRGQFATSVPAGTYRVLIHAFGRDSIIMSANGADYKTAQLHVTVRSGEYSRLDIVVDTGIR